MNCPTCPDSILVMTDRAGIEIDHCPQCRGVWLERGELDKIIDRSSIVRPAEAAAPRPTGRAEPPARRWDDDDDDDDWREASHGDGRRRRRRSMLGELFDF